MNPYGVFSLIGLVFSIPVSNWFLAHVGICAGPGPCVVPIAPGIWAPSGVLIIGFSLVLRDAVHEYLGARAAALGIVIGGLLALVWGDAWLALSACVAFLASEFVDLAVYDHVRRYSRSSAVLLSGLCGAVVDSFLFLILAFGSLEFMLGQVLAKIVASVIVAFVLYTSEKETVA